MNDDLALILEAAQAAGALALDMKRQGVKRWDKDGGQPVTEADIAVDTLLRESLGAARKEASERPRLTIRGRSVVRRIRGRGFNRRSQPRADDSTGEFFPSYWVRTRARR